MKETTKIETEVMKRDIDKYGHVNYAVHMEWYELGHQDFLRKAGIGGFRELEEDHGLRTLVRHADVEWLGELFEGDRISVQTAVDQIGNTSMRYCQIIAKDGEEVSRAAITVVFQDLQKQKCRIPDDIRAKLV
ncbi:MAG: thioesterase family protein [Nanoarchaeota archaeon]